MNKAVIDCKEIEYVSRLGVAFHLRDWEKARKLALTALVLCRLQARQAHAKTKNKWAEVRGLRRAVKKMEVQGMKVPLAELRVRELEEEWNAAQKELAGIGERMYTMLGMWQSAGATLEDLCNLCNRDPAQVREGLIGEPLEESLPALAAVYNLDYKIPRDTGWLEDSVDAPMTHALKAWLLDTMRNTEAGRKAAREALEAVFPEIMENALTEYIDPDGVRHLIDKDGVEVATLDGEE